MGTLPHCVSWVSAWRTSWPTSCGWVYIVYSFYLWRHIRQIVTSLDTHESCIFDQLEIQPSLILPRCMLFHNPHLPKWIYKTIIRYKRNITPCVFILFFSNTYNSVQANANQIWKFQRYYLVMEYAQRPVFVPPFIILNHVIHLIKGIYRRLRKCCRQKTTDREDSTRSYGLSMCTVLGRPSVVSLLDLS